MKRTDITARIGALAQQGLSAAKIAEQLELTRNQVVGYAHRYKIHLAGRDHYKPPAVHLAPPPPMPTATRSKRKCQYPFGDPGTSGFHFCGKPVEGNGPYCAAHYRRCYISVKPGAQA